MKRKSLAVIVLACLMMAGCGKEIATENVQESKPQQESQPVAESKQEEKTEQKESQAVVEKEEAKQQTESIEAVDENAWVPDEFVYNGVTSLDFVAPVVHNGDGEPCTFLWNKTEEDLKTWYLEKFGDEEGQLREHVNNSKIRQNGGTKYYTIAKNNYAEKEAYSISFKVGTYHESNVSQASFTIEDKEQEIVIAEAKDFLEMMGFGEYADDIIFSEELSLEIPTENAKGVYRVSSSYGVDRYDENYSIRVGVEYSDFDFTQYFWGYDAVGLESWEDYFSLGDYLENTEFDTSSLEAFTAEERAYKEQLYGTIYDQNISLEQSFNYIRYDQETLDDVEFEYWARATDETDEASGTLLIKFKLDDGKTRLDVSSFGRQPFENREEGRSVKRGEHITLEERQELCEARYELMKKLDGTIDWTVEDLLNRFNEMEFDEECDKKRYEGDWYEYHVMNDLENLALYGDFELKEEETIEE